MPEEAIPAPVEETPTPAPEAAPETPPEPTTNWEQRYQDLRPEFDRKSQQLSEYEALVEALSDPESRDEVLAMLGPEEAPVDDEADPYDTRLQAIEGYLQENAQHDTEQQQISQLAENIDGQFDTLEQEIGKKLSDEQLDTLEVLALANRDDQGNPDVKGAYEYLNKLIDAERQNWVQSKRSEQPLLGQPGSEQIDTSNQEDRVRAMAALIEAGQQE